MIRYAKIAGRVETTRNFDKQAKHLKRQLFFLSYPHYEVWCRHGDAYDSNKMVFNPLTPGSDWYMISPYSVSTESKPKVMRIEEVILN